MPNWKKVITSGSNAALNTLTVTSGITGTLTGNASTATSATSATTATNANNINISATTSTDTSTSVVLVADQSTGNQSPFIDSGLTYNANTNALTATTFIGALSGNATTATTATSATSATTATNATNYYIDSAASGIWNILGGSASGYTQASNLPITYSFTSGLLVTGSATIGALSAGISENTLTLGARNSVSEGGQLGLNAPGGTYTSASFIDNYANTIRILRGSNAGSDGLVTQWNLHTKQMQLPAYTSVSSFSGTAAANLAVDSSGNVITVSTTGGSVFPYNGNAVITGSLTTTGIIYAQPNGGMYFQGGDDAALYDINLSNHMGIYGVQDSTIGSIKLGSGGGIISGKSGNIGIGTTNPQYTLDVNGDLRASALTYGGSTVTLGSGLSLAGFSSVTINPGSSSNSVGLSGSIFLPNIGTATKSNVIYYDTTTKQLTYGATPTGTVTSVATAGTVSGITLTGGTITSSGTITLGGSISGLTNSNLSGTAGITNANLANSSVTIGTTAISLGSSATTITGLSSVTSTTFVGALTGTASGNLTSASTLTAGNLSGTIPSAVLANSTHYIGTTAVALNRASANLALTGISSIAFPGSTSGTATLQATATAGTPTLSLPTATGTLVGTGDTGTVTNTMLAGSIANNKLANSTISGISLGSNLNSLTAGSYLTWSSGTTYNGSAASTLAVDATSANTASKVVARDASGNFSAGTITAALSGNASTATSASFATAANTVNITTQNTTPVTYNIAFTGGTSGQQSLNVDASTLTYNPSTTTLTTGTVVANLTGNADSATYASAVGNHQSPLNFYIGGAENINNVEDLKVSLNGELYWNPTVQAIVVEDTAGTLARTMIGTIPGASGEGFLEATGTRMYYYSDRHIFGNNAYGYTGQFDAVGNFDAGNDITCGGTKFFDIPHQGKEGWGLKHAAIEGPESGVYFRGKLNGSNIIDLPEYWNWLVHKDTITVNLTPVGQYQALYVKEIKDNKVYIGSDDEFINCHFTVYAERADVNRWDAEYENYSRNEK